MLLVGAAIVALSLESDGAALVFFGIAVWYVNRCVRWAIGGTNALPRPQLRVLQIPQMPKIGLQKLGGFTPATTRLSAVVFSRSIWSRRSVYLPVGTTRPFCFAHNIDDFAILTLPRAARRQYNSKVNAVGYY
jgi:hypothetical protein